MQSPFYKVFTVSLILLLLPAFAPAQDASDDIVVTLIFTNDMESAYEPVPAWWRDDIERIGGIAELTTLIKNIRRDEPNVFLFDSGDIFTGALSRLTDGALMFEFMITMGYDAMAIGNHEFDYGGGNVRANVLMHQGRVRFQRLFHVNYNGQGIIVDVHVIQGIFCKVAIFGDNNSDRFTHVTNLVFGKYGMRTFMED